MNKEQISKTRKNFNDTLAYDIKLTEKYSKILVSQLFANINAEVSPEEFMALDNIYHKPDICQRDIAKLIIKDRANTGRLMDSLEKKGLITREAQLKNNKLIKKIILSEAGVDKINEILEKLMPVYETISSEFSKEEIDLVKDVLKRIRISMEKIVDIQI